MAAWKLFLTLLPIVLADVEVLSINLKGWEGCSNAQKGQISAGWEGAVKMAAALQGNINFNEAAAVEYLGPPVYTSPHQDEIRNFFQNAATFGQGSRWTPTPFKWDAYVRCDDWRSKCNRLGVDAYCGNYMAPLDFAKRPKRPDTDQEHDQSTMVMNFCPSFFNLVSFGEIVNRWKNDQNYIKYDLDWYRANRDYSVLHELMHGDAVAYKRNGNRHVFEMRFSIAEDPKNWKLAYGAANVKLFARVEDTFRGGWVTQNADTYAQYALAKAVQRALGNQYPHLPHALNGTIDAGRKGKNKPNPIPSAMQLDDSGLSWTPNVDNVIFSTALEATDATCDEDDCAPIIQVSEVLDDSNYPMDYVKQRNDWLDEFAEVQPQNLPSQSTSTVPAPENASQNCNFDPVYSVPNDPIDTSFAKSKITEVCSLFKDITLDDSKQPGVNMHYEDIGFEMYLWAAWNSGDPKCVAQGSGKITESHCVDTFNEMVNGCSSDDDTKTYGGSKVDSCIVYGFDVARTFTLDERKRHLQRSRM